MQRSFLIKPTPPRPLQFPLETVQGGYKAASVEETARIAGLAEEV